MRSVLRRLRILSRNRGQGASSERRGRHFVQSAGSYGQHRRHQPSRSSRNHSYTPPIQGKRVRIRKLNLFSRLRPSRWRRRQSYIRGEVLWTCYSTPVRSSFSPDYVILRTTTSETVPMSRSCSSWRRR